MIHLSYYIIFLIISMSQVCAPNVNNYYLVESPIILPTILVKHKVYVHINTYLLMTYFKH